MRDLLYQLGRTVAFGGIKHPDLTPFLKWVPWSISIVAALVFAILPVKPPLVGDGSLSRHLLTVFSTLPGFFIAALAAVATFGREEMDHTMPDPAPLLRLRVGNEYELTPLTMRLFLSHLFSYLTAIAFVAVFLFLGVDLLSKSGTAVLSGLNSQAYGVAAFMANLTYVAVATWLASKVVVTTLFGLYFLAERMHRPHE